MSTRLIQTFLISALVLGAAPAAVAEGNFRFFFAFGPSCG